MQWLNDWQTMVKRYASNQYVVGADLRNELRQACFGGCTFITMIVLIYVVP